MQFELSEFEIMAMWTITKGHAPLTDLNARLDRALRDIESKGSRSSNDIRDQYELGN